MATGHSAASLVQLPGPCLVAVLCCCAGDPRSIFNAARAHSRLQQAAGVVITTVKASKNKQQLKDLVLMYL